MSCSWFVIIRRAEIKHTSTFEEQPLLSGTEVATELFEVTQTKVLLCRCGSGVGSNPPASSDGSECIQFLQYTNPLPYYPQPPLHFTSIVIQTGVLNK
jgi:hypothetical protein